MNTLSIKNSAEFTAADAQKLMPAGRRPYIHVREALDVTPGQLRFEPGQSTTGLVSFAINSLHRSRDILEPPLNEDLASAVEALAAHVDPEEGLPYSNFNPFAARIVLDAVYEHAYRSDRDSAFTAHIRAADEERLVGGGIA